MREASTIQYRPTVLAGLVLTGIFAATAIILAWLGMILDPSDVDAMDGFTRVLFTAVPIRLFSWAGAAICLLFAGAIARRTFRSAPTLVLSESGLVIHERPRVPWSDIRAADVTRGGVLRIVVDRRGATERLDAAPALSRQRRSRTDQRSVTLSSFDLGADPSLVAAEIEVRRAPSVSNE